MTKTRSDDLTPFDAEASRLAWDRASDLWDDFVGSGKDYYRTEFHGPALLQACGDVAGLRVLDLGCGSGYFSRLLANEGAKVVGIDLSGKMIDLAIRNSPDSSPGIDFRVLNASEIADHFPNRSFDLVVGCVSMQDMADIPAVARGAHRVLANSGRFVFSIPHPATVTPSREWDHDSDGVKGALKVDRYFDSGPRVLKWEMKRLERHWETPYWSLTIEGWSEILEGAGFLIRRLREPRPSADAVRRVPALEDSLRLPSFLIFDAVPGATGVSDSL
jgi:ubiquinone/menaquinone biosynthesis C-methylase UbiE